MQARPACTALAGGRAPGCRAGPDPHAQLEAGEGAGTLAPLGGHAPAQGPALIGHIQLLQELQARQLWQQRAGCWRPRSAGVGVARRLPRSLSARALGSGRALLAQRHADGCDVMLLIALDVGPGAGVRVRVRRPARPAMCPLRVGGVERRAETAHQRDCRWVGVMDGGQEAHMGRAQPAGPDCDCGSPQAAHLRPPPAALAARWWCRRRRPGTLPSRAPAEPTAPGRLYALHPWGREPLSGLGRSSQRLGLAGACPKHWAAPLVALGCIAITNKGALRQQRRRLLRPPAVPVVCSAPRRGGGARRTLRLERRGFLVHLADATTL